MTSYIILMLVSFSKYYMGWHLHHWVSLYSRKTAVAGQLGQPPGETVLYSIDVASLAEQSFQYGPQITGTAFLLNLEKAPAIYHLKENGLKTTKTAIINN